MMGFPTATTTGTVALPGRFQAAAATPAFFAAVGLSDGGVPAPATAACGSALVAIVHTLIRSVGSAPRRKAEIARTATAAGAGSVSGTA
uniref:Uncharacterized protein n=1 Tax=Arundo donax TaxID=35708 RepID=A0A0A9G245_ARUDO